VFSDNCLSKYIMIIWFETGLLSLSYGFKLGLKPKLKRHFVLVNFGLKPVFYSKPRFLANVNSCSHVHVRYMSSSVRLSVYRLSVTFVHPTQPIEIFGNVSAPWIRWWPDNIEVKFYGDRPGEPLRRGVKPKSVRKNVAILDLRGYISETVQDRR